MSERDLTPEALDLFEHEQVIERGLTGFVEVGLALLAIRDGKKYRHGGYATFEDYCQRRWNMTRKRGYDLMAAAETVAELSPTGDIPAPQSERQVRPLRGVDPEQRAEVWAQAVEAADGEQPTARQVEEAVAAHLAPTVEPVALIDEWELDVEMDDVPEVLDAVDADTVTRHDSLTFEPIEMSPERQAAIDSLRRPKVITGTDGKRYTVPTRPVRDVIADEIARVDAETEEAIKAHGLTPLTDPAEIAANRRRMEISGAVGGAISTVLDLFGRYSLDDMAFLATRQPYSRLWQQRMEDAARAVALLESLTALTQKEVAA